MHLLWIPIHALLNQGRLNLIFKSAFEWGGVVMETAVAEVLNRGECGLDGFVKFLRFFVFIREMGLGWLFQAELTN